MSLSSVVPQMWLATAGDKTSLMPPSPRVCPVAPLLRKIVLFISTRRIMTLIRNCLLLKVKPVQLCETLRRQGVTKYSVKYATFSPWIQQGTVSSINAFFYSFLISCPVIQGGQLRLQTPFQTYCWPTKLGLATETRCSATNMVAVQAVRFRCATLYRATNAIVAKDPRYEDTGIDLATQYASD